MAGCLVIVEGTDSRCPLCHRLVYSGTRHECNGGAGTTEPIRKSVVGVKVEKKEGTA